MKRLVPIMAGLLAFAGCDRAPPEPLVTIENAVVTLPVLPDRPGAAYFTVRTNNDPTRLTGVGSPRIGRIELHETVTVNGVSRMTRLREATFGADAPLTFEPGGRHAMLFEIDPSVRIGDSLPVTFTFDPAPPVTVEAQVRAAGDTGHGGH